MTISGESTGPVDRDEILSLVPEQVEDQYPTAQEAFDGLLQRVDAEEYSSQKAKRIKDLFTINFEIIKNEINDEEAMEALVFLRDQMVTEGGEGEKPDVPLFLFLAVRDAPPPLQPSFLVVIRRLLEERFSSDEVVQKE